VEAKSLELFWLHFIEKVNSTNSYTLLKRSYFWMAKFLMKFAFFDKRKMALLVAKFFGA